MMEKGTCSVDVKAMFMYDERLETFKDWPLNDVENAKCTGDRMAFTGFYRPNPVYEPDLACCFMCHKELEGWEETDDPEEEHKKHSSKCPFLSFKERNVMKITIKDFTKLRYLEVINLHDYSVAGMIKEMEKQIADYISSLLAPCQ